MEEWNTEQAKESEQAEQTKKQDFHVWLVWLYSSLGYKSYK